jgi:hypothetical protein
MSESNKVQFGGIEARILEAVRKLRTRYPLGRYEMSFHLDAYNGEAFYDRVLESIEDAGGFRVRFVDKSSIDIPLAALKDVDKPDFLDKWGEIIYKTRM